MQKLPKLSKGDHVAILSPSFAAPGKFPEVYEFGLRRMRDVFGLVPVEYPTTKKLGASKEERATDLIAAFSDPGIKAVIATIGGDDQVTYIKNLPSEPFVKNPKPFFGFSDNTHLMNFLWLNGIPSFYGGSVMTQLAMQGKMDDFTVAYLKKAFFETGECEIVASESYNEIGLDWGDAMYMTKERVKEINDGWQWDGSGNAEGITWGGCLESVDELLRHGIPIPSLQDFEGVVLMLETSEEIPSADYVYHFLRALGERGILARVRAVLVGRPKAWEFDKPRSKDERTLYVNEQRATIIKAIRAYNEKIPIVQNLNFGHTDPQIPFPYGGRVRVDGKKQKLFVCF